MAVGVVQFPAFLDDAVSLGEVANGVQTTLASAITAIQTSIPLSDASFFPTSGIATIQKMQVEVIGGQNILVPVGFAEIIHWTGKSGVDLTPVLRGQQGLAAAPHDAGDYVQMRITKLHHEVHSNGLIAVETKLGVGASTPAAGKLLRSPALGASIWEDATFEHMQAAPAAVWTITHNLFSRPVVHTVDNSGAEIKGEVAYVSLNQLTITFSQAVNGRAYLN